MAARGGQPGEVVRPQDEGGAGHAPKVTCRRWRRCTGFELKRGDLKRVSARGGDQSMADYKPSPLARDAMAYVLAGGARQPPDGTDRPARQARRLFRRQVAHHRLRAVERAQLRHPPHRVATQYKAHSLIRHLQRGWNFLRPERNESFDILPASPARLGDQWYEGTADAVYQNIDIIEDYGPRYIVILAGDHIYKMDYELMLRSTSTRAPTSPSAASKCRAWRRPASASCMSTARTASSISSKSRRTRRAFPTTRTWRWPRWASTSSRRDFLMDQLRRDAADRRVQPRFRQGHHPLYRQERQGLAHRFTALLRALDQRGSAYWRDVGTVDAYWEANIDLTDVTPELDLYDRDWPIWTYAEITPPAKFVHDEDGRRGRRCPRWSRATASSRARADRTLLFTGVRVQSYSELERPWCCPTARSAATRG
jgi:glucose-1-phosphate adenylyltransferase